MDRRVGPMNTLTASIPTLETDRLILRPPHYSDQQALASFGATDRSHFVGGPWAVQDVWSKLLGIAGHWHIRGFGLWFITKKDAPDIAIGWTGGIHHIDWPEAELGWCLFEDQYQGHGIAYEAAECARRALAQVFDLHRPISLIAQNNTRSATLAKRLGAKPENVMTLRGHKVTVYRHPDDRNLS